MNNKYAELLTKALPAIIETEAENERILGIINDLISKGELSPDERKLLRLLTKLVEDFEERIYPMPENTDPLGTMLFLMEQNGYKQADMIDVFGSSGRVSDVINRKRGISKNHARKLADKFNVPADLFI
jgi:HTH-type transcriptional regulator/antitoxin HigA